MNITFEETLEPVSGVSLLRKLLVDTEKPFQLNEFVVKRGEQTPVDQHDMAEIWHVQSGHGILHFDGEAHELKPGSWFHFPPNKSHQATCADTSDMQVLSIYWKPE
jgi:quercetin dioxygenase-like cupin family protein